MVTILVCTSRRVRTIAIDGEFAHRRQERILPASAGLPPRTARIMNNPPHKTGRRVLGRYMMHDEIASGGMATVYTGHACGPGGFTRTVAIKKLHGHLAENPDVVAMFLDEARLAARINHPNVVAVHDVGQQGDEVFLVMDFVAGASLEELMVAASRQGEVTPPPIAAALVLDVLHGLHAAHEATAVDDRPLGIVHRDVSPQNILVGADGLARIIDFGVAKAVGRLRTTKNGQIKGKFPYMAPEQIAGEKLDRRTDLFALSVVFWEMLTGQYLFEADDVGALLHMVLTAPIQRPQELKPEVPEPLDELVMKGLRRDPNGRFQNAKEMALALERSLSPAGRHTVGEWVERLASETLSSRAQLAANVEIYAATAVAVPAPLSSSNNEADEPDEGANEPSDQAAGSSEQPRSRTAASAGVGAEQLVDPTDGSSAPSRAKSAASTLPAIAGAPSGGSTARLILAVAAVALTAGLLWWLSPSDSKPDPTPGTAAHRDDESIPAAEHRPTHPTTTTAPTTTAPKASPTTPSASRIGTSRPPPKTARPKAASTSTAKPTAAPSASAPASTGAPKADCAVPYTIDAHGIKHYKTHCIQ